LFFDKARKAEREAKKICAGCPVIAECLEQALVYNYEGVWGGTSAKERRSLKLRNTAKYLREDYKESGLYNAALKV
jgi:WhiB family redox-sensing transcriptional regulator